MFVALNLIGLAAALVLSFISSGMETALYRVSQVRMRIRAEKGDPRASAVIKMLGRLDSMVTTILIDNNIAAYAATYFTAAQLSSWNLPYQELVTTALVTPLFFVLTESLPKQLSYNDADAWSMSLVRVFSAFRIALAPSAWLLNRVSALLRGLFGSKGEVTMTPSQRSLLLEHLNAGVAEDVLSAEQSGMAGRIMELEGISARDSMMLLRTFPLLPPGATRAKAVREMSRKGMPLALMAGRGGRPNGMAVTMASLVMADESPDALVDASAERLEAISANAAIPQVLNLFRTRHARQALVMEKGNVLGVITTVSVLDRIAGIQR